jgi:hypothetical protein
LGDQFQEEFSQGEYPQGQLQLGGVSPDGNIPFPLMKKGERFIICVIEMLGERAQRHVDRGSNPKESSVRGSSPKGRYPFPLISKGER